MSSIHIGMMRSVEHQQARVSECVCYAVDVDVGRCLKIGKILRNISMKINSICIIAEKEANEWHKKFL